jgi:23S rRNA (adenine2503-C2)-methyltransferase
MTLIDIKALRQDELASLFSSWNLPQYRVPQLTQWLYSHRVTTWDAMTNLPVALREKLAAHFSLVVLTLSTQQGAPDQTRKFLWRLPDGSFIESVLIPANPALYSEPSDRLTLCVSTQVGCAYGCKFCASGLRGWKRNLHTSEIVEQVLATERLLTGESGNRPDGKPDKLVNNLVIMGMGEPLANYEELMKALLIINAPWGLGIGARKITISTSGLAPEIRRLADEPQQYRLAISLHAATNEVRQRIMPVNRKYPLEILLDACDYYIRKKGRMISFEYILIEGVNDGLDQAALLSKLARRFHAKVNLIPFNRVDELPWKRPSQDRQEAFLDLLTQGGVAATLRREKGDGIDAACGQLRLKMEAL